MKNPQDFLNKFSNIHTTKKPKVGYVQRQRRREHHYRSATAKFSKAHMLQYKNSILQKYKQGNEKSFFSGEEVSLTALYTEPVISQKSSNGSFQNISVMKLFEPSIHQNNPLTVFLQGSPGSGKSFICQNILLDWASGKYYLQHFDLAFYLRCEELKSISEEMNLIELLSWSSSLTSDQITQTLQKPSCSVLFIIDGLDELSFMHHEFWISSQFQKAPPEVTVCSMLRQQILPRSFLLATARTEVTQDMLLIKPQNFLKIIGFSENEIKEYFQKFFQDYEPFTKAFSCVKGNEALFTTCSTPVICWIICTILQERLNDDPDVINRLETTTSIYIEFVSILLEHHSQSLSHSVPTLLMSLGQLAESGMMDQQVLFEEKHVNVTVSDPTDSPFLSKFLSKRSVHQKTMFSFTHRSFQEFFTALYYVLLDEDKSHRKVKELLHTVERGWALSCWSHSDLSMADEEVRHSELLQPVILFLCGLCKKERIPSFFQKHNMSVSVNIETQLKDWISQCSLRYQNEHMLFILHCLYELHEKSFTGKVLEGLILMDLSNIPLKRTDCWVLRYCLQSCNHITNLKLQLTSDHLKTLQPELYRCQELRLMMDYISDNVVGLMSAVGKEKILNKITIKDLENVFITMPDQDGDIIIKGSATELTVTSPCSAYSSISWVNFRNKKNYPATMKKEVLLLKFLQSVTDLKKVYLQDSELSDTLVRFIPSFIQASPSLTELSITVKSPLTVQIQSLKISLKDIDWTLTIWGKLILIQPGRKTCKDEELKIKTEKLGESSNVSSSAASVSRDCREEIDMFIPEVLQGHEDKYKKQFRFVCPHAGQFRCSLTGLVFVVEAEAELLYKTVTWDPRLLDGLGQMQPAGPLYSIDCFKDSISQLHLPHCEILSVENKDVLSVAHYTGGNVEIVKPLKVTETHVMIEINNLSIFGIIKMMFFPPSPVVAQVLLFLRPKTVRHRENVLDVHLLPCNVPVSEVKEQHAENTHIKTSSKCSLTPGKEYSLMCQPERTTVQPETEIFECNFGPNYHPTFEVFVDVNTEEVTLGLKTEGKEVWRPRRILLTGNNEEPPAYKRLKECEFVEKHRHELIQRVSSVMAIADGLRAKNMIAHEIYSEIQTAKPRMKKNRLLLDALDSGGASVKAEFYRLLKEQEGFLVDELESGPSSVFMRKHLTRT